MDPSQVLPDVRKRDAMVNELKRKGAGDMNELKQEIMFNRSLLWLLLAHVIENQRIATLFAVVAALGMLNAILSRALSR